jgi:hypothetical protein
MITCSDIESPGVEASPTTYVTVVPGGRALVELGVVEQRFLNPALAHPRPPTSVS